MSFRHFGLAYGGGIVQNLRRQPWRLLLVPAFMAAYARAARRAAADADVVHAHWLPSALAARATGKPFVVAAVGHRRRARAAPPVARPAPAPRRGGRRGGLAVACRVGHRARRACGRGDPGRGRDARRRRGAGAAAARPLRRAAVGGEGHSRVSGGDGGHPEGDRRRRAAASRAFPRQSASSPPGELGRWYERALPWSACRHVARATA